MIHRLRGASRVLLRIIILLLVVEQYPLQDPDATASIPVSFRNHKNRICPAVEETSFSAKSVIIVYDSKNRKTSTLAPKSVGITTNPVLLGKKKIVQPQRPPHRQGLPKNNALTCRGSKIRIVARLPFHHWDLIMETMRRALHSTAITNVVVRRDGLSMQENLPTRVFMVVAASARRRRDRRRNVHSIHGKVPTRVSTVATRAVAMEVKAELRISESRRTRVSTARMTCIIYLHPHPITRLRAVEVATNKAAPRKAPQHHDPRRHRNHC